MVKIVNSSNELNSILQNSSNKVTILDFYADWCGPCKMLTPVLENLSKIYKDQLNVFKVDVDNSDDLPKMHNVRCMPTLVFIVENQVVDDLRIEGFSESSLVHNISKSLKLIETSNLDNNKEENNEKEENNDNNESNQDDSDMLKEIKEKIEKMEEVITNIAKRLEKIENQSTENELLN
jgi:thioredoxin 1